MTKCEEVFCPNYYSIAGHKTVGKPYTCLVMSVESGLYVSGYGHDCCENDDCSSLAPAPLSELQASQLLQCDLSAKEKFIGRIPGAETMNSNQLSAFVDFAFNAGPGNFRTDFEQQIRITGLSLKYFSFRNQFKQLLCLLVDMHVRWHAAFSPRGPTVLTSSLILIPWYTATCLVCALDLDIQEV